MILSDVIISVQRFVFIIDEIDQEKVADKLLCQLLKEQGHEMSSIKKLDVNENLNNAETFANFIEKCGRGYDNKWHVILPTLNDLLCYQRPSVIFKFISQLRCLPQVQHVLLWATRSNVMHREAEYLLAAFEWLAELTLHIESKTQLSIIARKPRGGVTNNRYNYNANKQFQLELVSNKLKQTEDSSSPKKTVEEQFGTFKIELEEDELMARNATKMPYERTEDIQNKSGNIIYTPDVNDDFDDEDPDEDLCI